MEDIPTQQAAAVNATQVESGDLFGRASAAENPLPTQRNVEDSPRGKSNAAGRSSAKYALGRSDILEIRRQRIADYEFDVLTKEENHFEALIGAATADLFGIATVLAEGVKEALTSSMTAKERPRIEAELNTLLRFQHQIGQFGELGVRAAEARTQAELAKTTLATMTIHGHRLDPAEPLLRQKSNAK